MLHILKSFSYRSYRLNGFILLILSLCINLVLSCSVHVCLTWEATPENIVFKCRVDDLSWKIYFYNPSEEELGHCTTPFPVSTCFPTKNNLITQDRESNTTILIVNRHVDSALNGLWRCAHGTKRDDAFVNVTIIKEVSVKQMTSVDGCYESFWAWTFIGSFMCGVFFVIIWMVLNLAGNTIPNKLRTENKMFHAWVKQVICIIIVGLVVLIPLGLGLHEKSCKDKKSFIILGIVAAGILIVIVLIRRGSGNSDNDLTENESLT